MKWNSGAIGKKTKLLAESLNTNILMYLSGVHTAAKLVEGHGQCFINGKFFKQVLHSEVHHKILIQLKATKVSFLNRQGLGEAQKKPICWDAEKSMLCRNPQFVASHSTCLWCYEVEMVRILFIQVPKYGLWLFWIQALVSNLQSLPSKCNTTWKHLAVCT